MVKRYDADHEARCMFNCSDGDYVTFEDHEDELLNAAWHLNELQKKYDKLVRDIGERLREG